MTKHFKDYFWNKGFPYGREESEAKGTTYKILADPYNKWVSIEKFCDEKFQKVVYDSQLMNFRKLNPQEQTAWERIFVEEEVCHLRNQDDRTVCIERHDLDNQECRFYSPHGIFLAIQKINYQEGKVALFDTNGYPVLGKKYKVDEKTREFLDLIEEEWNFENCVEIIL